MGSREFSVYGFDKAGFHTGPVVRFVTAEEAFAAFMRVVKGGEYARVIITDGNDFTNAEWINGEGLTYPTEEELNVLAKPRE